MPTSRFLSIRNLDRFFASVLRGGSVSSVHCASVCPRPHRCSPESSLWFRSGRIGGVCFYSITWMIGWSSRSRGIFCCIIGNWFSSCAKICGLSSTGRSRTFNPLLVSSTVNRGDFGHEVASNSFPGYYKSVFSQVANIILEKIRSSL